MGQEVLKKFDRYFLLDVLAQGGMAEIYRARPATVDTAARTIVIKRILGGHGKNRDFIQMFRSETKVMMGFNHPNIAQLFDFGETREQPYIVMEFVDGKNLRQFLTKQAEKKERMPIELAVYIIEQAAAGLSYAHGFKDKITGDHLGIVHRDVSPQNILISYDGAVKLIDFGIAKAKTNSESTRVGIIKGKPSYLSPEQINGKELDGQSDVFSLGAVLWEVLAGKKLFAAPPGEGEFAVLKLIESCETYVKPPSHVNKEVPDELDYIVFKALAKDKTKRFKDAAEMQKSLRTYLNKNFPEFTPDVLSEYLKGRFSEAILEDRKRLRSLNAKAEQLLQKDDGGGDLTDPFNKVHQKPEIRPKKDPPKKKVAPKPQKSSVDHKIDAPLEGDPVHLDKKIRPKIPAPNPAPAPVKPIKAGDSLTIDGDALKKEKSFSGGQTQRTRTRTRKTVSSLQRSRISRPQRGTKGSLIRGFGILAAGITLVAVMGPQLGLFGGGSKLTKLFESAPTAPRVPNRETASSKTVTSKKDIRLRLKIPPGFHATQVTINGKKVDAANPVALVPLDAPLELQVTRKGFKPFLREFTLNSAQLKGVPEWEMEIPMEPLKYGYLSIRSTPSAEVTVTSLDDSAQGSLKMRTPVPEGRFPAGKYKIELRNEVLGMGKTLTREIGEGKTVRLDERLEVTE